MKNYSYSVHMCLISKNDLAQTKDRKSWIKKARYHRDPSFNLAQSHVCASETLSCPHITGVTGGTENFELPAWVSFHVEVASNEVWVHCEEIQGDNDACSDGPSRNSTKKGSSTYVNKVTFICRLLCNSIAD